MGGEGTAFISFNEHAFYILGRIFHLFWVKVPHRPVGVEYGGEQGKDQEKEKRKSLGNNLLHGMLSSVGHRSDKHLDYQEGKEREK